MNILQQLIDSGVYASRTSGERQVLAWFCSKHAEKDITYLDYTKSSLLYVISIQTGINNTRRVYNAIKKIVDDPAFVEVYRQYKREWEGVLSYEQD